MKKYHNVRITHITTFTNKAQAIKHKLAHAGKQGYAYLLKHSSLIYIGLFLAILLLHLLLKTNAGDDKVFASVELASLPDFLASRYSGWSSRIIIEAVLVLITHLPKLIWCVLDSLILTSIAWCISFIFTKNDIKCKLLSVVVIGIFPLLIMSTAGWYATTLNYLWPLACLLIATIPIKQTLRKESLPLWAKVACTICLLFACNQEQACLLLLGFYLIAILYVIYKKESVPKLFYFYIAIIVLSLIFIIACPGNTQRMASEITSWYPAFQNFNLIQKMMLGINGTFSIITVRGNVPYITLAILLIFYTRKMPTYIRAISIVPILLMLYCYFFSTYIHTLFPFLTKLYATIKTFNVEPGIKIGTNSPLSDISILGESNILLSCLSIASILALCFCLYKTLKGKQFKFWLPLIIVAGFLSTIIIGTSPTFFASDTRIFTFLDCALIIAILTLVYNQPRKGVVAFLIIIAALQTINLLWYVIFRL